MISEILRTAAERKHDIPHQNNTRHIFLISTIGEEAFLYRAWDHKNHRAGRV